MRTLYMPLLALTFAFAGCSSSVDPETINKYRTALDQSKVSLAQSVTVAQSSIAADEGGKVAAIGVNAALLPESEPVYSVGALGGRELQDVRVDIVTGAVVSKAMVGESDDPCPGSIPLADAITIAEGRVQGRAVKVQPDDDDHCLREVLVLSGDKMWEVKLSREGQVLEVEEADDDD
jgi:peptidase YpeB-like protein